MKQITIDLPEAVAAAASDKKAKDIVILDMRGISMVTDHFVICSANSTTQVQAIADNVEEQLKKAGVSPLAKEGYREARWILLDYGACVVHIFVEEDRQFYNLERLWGEAEKRVYQD